MAEAIAERSPGGRYVRFMEKLGSGASKDVYRAYDTQEGLEVAWNVVNLSGVPKNERNRIVNEVRLLERLHHHNIISFYGSWVNRERQEVHFVTEILSSGTLKSFITRIQVIRWKVAKRWAFQILKGLQYLHSQGVIHRDLKCENIFINGTSGDLRIGDLGLSTSHRNGRVLSVLGTPEFMAPDLYEDKPYDYKVDIYAFGMCMLEIFTKDIPYRECTNPAQIYRKVSRGELPASLSRVRNKEGKEFIILCLGYKDLTTGEYVRPTTTDLLAHDFFAKGKNDDGVVLVDPAPIGGAITEEQEVDKEEDIMSTLCAVEEASSTNESSSTVSSTNPLRLQQQLQYDKMRKVKEEAGTKTEKIVGAGGTYEGTAEEDSDEHEDQLLEMPQNEQNFKEGKVMMGRNKSLQNDKSSQQGNQQQEKAPAPTETAVAQTSKGSISSGKNSSQSSQGEDTSVQLNTPAPKESNTSKSLEQQLQGEASLEHKETQNHYLTAAAIVKNEDLKPGEALFADNYLNLIITLPIQGQTQNVQFDFHLVEDDPVQVAKEMVEELGIPGEAVLEISETISGLARAARMQRDNSAAGTEAASSIGSQQQQTQRQTQSQESRSSSSTIPGGSMTKGTSATSSHSSSSGSVSHPRGQQQLMHQHHHQQQQRVSNRSRGNTQQQQSSYAQPHHNMPHRQSQPTNQQQNRQQMQHYGAQQNQHQPGQMYQQQLPNMRKQPIGTRIPQAPALKDGPKMVDKNLRKLDQEYQQHLLEANQQFGADADDLKRSVNEHEAEHVKALQKHEEERDSLVAKMENSEKRKENKLTQLRVEYESRRAAASKGKKEDKA